MPKHEVKQGEDVHSIARQYGVPAEKIINFAANKSLWQENRDDEILSPGDSLEIPSLQPRTCSVSTGSRAKFKFKLETKSKIRIVLEDIDGPRAKVSYRFDVGSKVFEGETGDDGSIEEDVPLDSKSATLELLDFGETYKIDIGHLNPAHQISGAKQRLSNLGYFSGALTDSDTPQFRNAVKRFQDDNNLSPTGNLNPETQNKITDTHKC